MKLGLAAFLVAVGVLASGGSAEATHRRGCCPPPCPPSPPQQVILQVCHPCTGCKHDVLVCIPACCQGTPCVSFHNTLIGRGRTVFEWNNGYQVVVRYQADGGYRVIQRG